MVLSHCDSIFTNEAIAIEFLIEKDIIKRVRPCLCRDSTPRLQKDGTRRPGYYYKCQRTKQKTSVIKGTVLEYAKTPANEYLKIILMFVMDFDTLQSESLLKVGRKVFYNLKGKIRKLLKKVKRRRLVKKMAQL